MHQSGLGLRGDIVEARANLRNDLAKAKQALDNTDNGSRAEVHAAGRAANSTNWKPSLATASVKSIPVCWNCFVIRQFAKL